MKGTDDRRCVHRKHDLVIRRHRVRCRSCGSVSSIETCERTFTIKEPGGTRNLYCGHFSFDEKAGVKQLWDLYRQSAAYSQRDMSALTQPYPPAWFLEEELGLGAAPVKP